MKTDLLLFHWQAIDESGGWQQGNLLAKNRQQAALMLDNRQLTPLRLRPKRRYRISDWDEDQRIALMRQLATLLKAGLTLTACLTMLSEGNAHPGWCALLSQLESDIAQGNAFTKALGNWPAVFPPLYIALIGIGESTGQLDNSCLKLAELQERRQKLQKKVTKTLRYPLFILLIATAVCCCMLLFVLPEFAAIYANFDTPLPAFTSAVMKFASFLQIGGPWLLLALIIAAIFWSFQRRQSVKYRIYEQRVLLKLPLISVLYRGSMLSQIFTSLSLTQRAGLPLTESLKATKITLPPGLWQQALVAMQHGIEAGGSLYQTVAGSRLFTPLCYHLVRTGEESGAMDDMLSRLAHWHETQTHDRADALVSLLEPVMIVIIGGIIGILVVAMYLPVFNLGTALG